MNSVKYRNPKEIEYITIYFILNEDGTINSEKTMKLIIKFYPDLFSKYDSKMPFSKESVYKVLSDNGYEESLTEIPPDKKFIKVMFQRDKMEIIR